MSNVLDPVLDDIDSDYGNTVAHIVKKSDQMAGYVEGKEITALCGYKWVPARDYKDKPVCQACKDEFLKRERRAQ